MSEIVYLTGITVTFALAASSVLYLRKPLARVLLDLCGTKDRADFWGAFSALILIFVPLVCVTQRPSARQDLESLLEIGSLVRRGMIGIVASLAAVGVTLSHFIARELSRK